MRLTEALSQVLDRRLSHHGAAPILVGFSGGGDSLALLLAARHWAARAARTLVAATVDHRLQNAGAQWARACARRCADLGLDHLTLRWDEPPPAAGVAAAARMARHRLLADAARAVGASVVLLGHTADDVLEAGWMRAAGATTPAPREWSPSPAWPQGRGIFLLRPLISARRAELRAWLDRSGESWIEDPANTRPESLRARARAALDGVQLGRVAAPACAAGRPPLTEGPGGELAGFRASFVDARDDLALTWLGVALLCASGRSRPPRRRALEALVARVRSGEAFCATLAGACLTCAGDRLWICREAADRRGGGPQVLDLPPGEPVVWDGRYELIAHQGGLRVTALCGHVAALPEPLRPPLGQVVSRARAAIPLVRDEAGRLMCPTLSPEPVVEARSLITARLVAACGGVDHESAIVAWRNGVLHPKSAPVSGKRPADEFA